MALRRGLSGFRQRVLALDDLCRGVVMIRAGAAPFYQTQKAVERGHPFGPGVGWYGRCECCSRPRWLQWSHYFTRGIYAVRWDVDNSHSICSGCHYNFHHPRPPRMHAFETWMRLRLGDEVHDALVLRAAVKGRIDLSGWEVKMAIMAKDAFAGRRQDAAPESA